MTEGQSERQRQRQRQDVGPEVLGGVQRVRQPIAARKHDPLFVRARGHDRDDRHTLAQRQLDEARAAGELDLMTLAPGAEGLDVGAGIDEHHVALLERARGAGVAGPQDPGARGEAMAGAVVEHEVVGERVQHALGAEVVADGREREEAIERNEAPVVVADEQRRTARGQVADAMHVESEEAPEGAGRLAEPRDQRRIAGVEVVLEAGAVMAHDVVGHGDERCQRRQHVHDVTPANPLGPALEPVHSRRPRGGCRRVH